MQLNHLVINTFKEGYNKQKQHHVAFTESTKVISNSKRCKCLQCETVPKVVLNNSTIF